MNWNQVLTRLENEIIKVDVMASSDADFMATHMPFQKLSVTTSGYAHVAQMSEEEIYQKLIVNPQNIHRLMMIKGANGSGKSHLIRWFQSRLTSDKSAYDPAKEKMVFIRRLGNTLRSAVAQLLEEGVVQDPQVKERMSKFVKAADSQDEAHFKSTIYYNFITEIENDSTSEIYSPAERRDLVAFLNDFRVKEVMLQETGPVSRCYAQIAKPMGVVFGGEAAFVASDFILERTIIRAIKNDGASEARRLLNRLEDEAETLAHYINRFTSSVISRCSNISQGDTREVFAQLRKELKKQGKNLTIFIEDFTAFTGVDAELITVLAVEHGGANDDYCRVTAVIGITDAYYDQFKDNFVDRVTHQVEVGEEAYGSPENLAHMAALYLNAAYCSKNSIAAWYQDGVVLEELPQAAIEVPFAWESVEIGGKKLTLYPFNGKALVKLYDHMQAIRKTPREFLRAVIRVQMSAYLRDQISGEHTRFPDYTAVKGMIEFETTHSTYIDDLPNLTMEDRRRLRTLLSLWGDANASAGENKGIATIGGLPTLLFKELGFGSFQGLGGSRSSASGTDVTPDKKTSTSKPAQKASTTGSAPTPPPPPPISRQEQQYNERIADIDGWFQNQAKLRFSPDSRVRLDDFITNAINWQLEGIAAHLAKARLKNKSLIYIDGQQEGSPNKAAVYFKRTPENRDVLVALATYHYHEKNWGFPGAPYFQLQLITWLESVKQALLNAVRGGSQEQDWPVFRWAMTAEYLRLGVMGYLSVEHEEESLRPLLYNAANLNAAQVRRLEGKGTWADLQTLISGSHSEEFRQNKVDLIQLKNTHMGVINQAGGATNFFNLNEIYGTIQELQRKDWDIADELPINSTEPGILTLSVRLVKNFLPKVKIILDEERTSIRSALSTLQQLLGMEINADNLKIAANAMMKFFNTMNQRGINYPSVLKLRVEDILRDAQKLAQLCTRLEQSLETETLGTSLRSYSFFPLKSLQEAITTIVEVKRLAESKSSEYQRNLRALGSNQGVNASLVGAALGEIGSLIDKIEAIEVEQL